MKKSPFFKQAQLMLQMVPHVAAEKHFALKGGTAINIFVRDMPRLSIDIDLTYVPVEPREVSLKNIEEALQRIALRIRAAMPQVKVHEIRQSRSKLISKLLVRTSNADVKIEPNEVIRGTVFPCEEREISGKAEKLFGLSASIFRGRCSLS